MKERDLGERAETTPQKLISYVKRVLGTAVAIGLGFVGLRVVARGISALIP